jgi:hypothetical protein
VRLATGWYRWRDLGASGDRLGMGISVRYVGSSTKHWTKKVKAAKFGIVSALGRLRLPLMAWTWRAVPDKGESEWLLKRRLSNERRKLWQ